MTRIKKYQMLAVGLLAFAVMAATTPAHAQYSVIYSFGVTDDSGNPIGAIAQGEDGALYSTAIPSEGGTVLMGQVYKVTTAGKANVLLNAFCTTSGCPDGYKSLSGLTLRPDGHFLGTTSENSSDGNGFGTIFDISQTGTLSTLFNFTGDANGGGPQSAPIVGPDGAFYGVTSSSNVNCGTIYRLTSVLTTIHTFATGAKKGNGCTPYGALVLGSDGSFYGTNTLNGPNGYGVVFKATYTPGKATLVSILAAFNSTTGSPVGALVEGTDGNFYGVTNPNFYSETGVTNQGGTIYKVTPSGDLTVVHVFDGSTDGAFPQSGLILGSDGNLYGTALSGGTASQGILFQLTLAGAFSAIHNFGSVPDDGFGPVDLVQHTNGLLYGGTNSGGAMTDGFWDCIYAGQDGGCGTIFSWNGGLPAFVKTVPSTGTVGATVEILGQGFTSSSTVSFNGVAATVKVQSGTSLLATVPAGAATGSVTVTTSTGTLTSNQQFTVVP